MSEARHSTADRLPSGLRSLLSRRVAWLTDQRRDMAGEPSDAAALVVVLGREHYTERRRSFPIASLRDLDAVLAQDLAGAPTTLTLVAPVRNDRRDVTFFELKEEAVARIGRTAWVIPESVLLAAGLAPGSVATVERAGFRYFLAASGESQPEGGAVASAELFALAIGLDPGRVERIEADSLRERLLAGLRRLPPGAWLRLRLPAKRLRLRLEWRPVVIALASAAFGYLSVASGYLLLTKHAREAELAGLGSEVENLLDAQREVDRLLSEQQGLADLLARRQPSYRLWQVVAAAWAKRAEVTGIELRDAELVLRGTAPVATDVLAAVAALPGVNDARFSASVRAGSKGTEQFAISLKMTGADGG